MRFFLFLISLTLIQSISYSQEFYIKAGGGYAIGTATKEYRSFYQAADGGSFTTKNKNNYYSYGGGISFGGGIGYIINSNFACEVEYSYLISSKRENNSALVESESFSNLTNTLSAKTSYIIPSFLLMTELGGFKPYLKIGAAIGFPELKETYLWTDNSPYTQEQEFVSNGGLSIGISTGIGVSWKTGSIINVFAEINNTSISYAPEKGKLVKANENGVSYLDDYSVREKEFEYSDEYIYGNPDPNKPYKSLKTSYPFSSLSFSLGVSIVLFK